MNSTETIALTDLKPVDGMRGGGWTGTTTLNGTATIGATGIRRLDGFVVIFDRSVNP